ncbi:MAG: RDD family protein [Candidatus Microbacterium colombiense]|nr:MAG: RDD family protein [Microbacterium sp.]
MTQLAFGRVAPISRRAVAYLIDALIAGGLGIVLVGGLVVAATLTGGLDGMLSTLLVGGPIVSLVLLGWFIVYTLMQAGNGSIGMRAQGLRLASAADGAPLGFGRALLRNIIFGLAGSIVVGYFSPLFDGSGRFQGWHDKVGGALVLDARAATTANATPVAPVTPAKLPSGLATSAGPAIPGLARPSAPAGGPFAPPAPSPFPAPVVAPAHPAPPLPTTAAPPAPSFAPPAPPFAQPAPSFAQPAQPAPPAPTAAPVTPVAAAAVPAALPAADADDLIAYVPGITQDSAPGRATPAPDPSAPAPSAPAAPVPPVQADAPAAPAPASAAASDDDLDIEDTRISIPGHRLVFTWDDGTRVSVSRRTIFGRNPGPEDGAVIIPVRDETLSLSKTHFEAAAEISGGWVLDRHSTNGMTIVREGQRIACPAGQRVPVRLGDAIEIGDRIVTIGGYA